MRMMNIRTLAALIGILVFNLALALGLQEGKGRPLVEVFKVTVNNIDGENPGDLYGTILITDGLVSQYVFNRERANSESIKPGEDALLTGPAGQVVTASDSFTIDVALMDKDEDFSPDDHISDGQIQWNVKDTRTKYDVPISHKIDGQYGSATVVYAVLSNAVQATVEVILIDGDGENPADVYGFVAAHSNKFSSDYQSVLFKRNSGDYATVKPAQRIPLSKSILAVPLDSTLIVRADLYDYDTFSSDDEIAKGTASFTPQLSGTLEERKIYGQYGQIEVKVTWTQSLKYKKHTNITIN